MVFVLKFLELCKEFLKFIHLVIYKNTCPCSIVASVKKMRDKIEVSFHSCVICGRLQDSPRAKFFESLSNRKQKDAKNYREYLNSRINLLARLQKELLDLSSSVCRLSHTMSHLQRNGIISVGNPITSIVLAALSV